MSFLVPLTLILIVVGGIGGRVRLGRRRDNRSIESHRNTLGVIEQVSGAESHPEAERSAAHVRLLVPAPTRDPSAAAEDEPDLPTHPTYRHQPGRPVFPSVRPEPVPPIEARELAPVLRVHHRRQWTGSPATRVLASALAATAVVVMAADLAGALAHGTRRPAHVASSSSTTERRAAPASAGPTTTVPITALIATSTSSQNATYSVNTDAIALTVSTSTLCWAEIRQGSAGGPLVFEGTLTAAASRTFSSAGTVWLRLGDPLTARLTVNGSPVNLPSASDPFNLTFVTPA